MTARWTDLGDCFWIADVQGLRLYAVRCGDGFRWGVARHQGGSTRGLDRGLGYETTIDDAKRAAEVRAAKELPPDEPHPLAWLRR